MARGAEAKSAVAAKILETFAGSFTYNDGKEIRIPVAEGAEVVQIKVTLTCAKENVSVGSDTAIPGGGDFPVINQPVTVASNEPIAPTDAEKARVAELLRNLGL